MEIQYGQKHLEDGNTRSFGAGNLDVFLVKTNVNGDMLWMKTIGGTEFERGSSIRQTLDGNFIITGFSNSFGVGQADVYLIKTDEVGDTIWTRTYGGVSDDYGNAVEETTDGNYIIAGRASSFSSNGLYDVYLLKVGTTTNVVKLEGGPNKYQLIQNYPNPFNPSTTINYQIPERSFVMLKVYDVLGSEITTLVNEEKPVGSYEVEFDAMSLPSGIYFYRLQAGSFVETKKMVLMK